MPTKFEIVLKKVLYPLGLGKNLNGNGAKLEKFSNLKEAVFLDGPEAERALTKWEGEMDTEDPGFWERRQEELKAITKYFRSRHADKIVAGMQRRR